METFIFTFINWVYSIVDVLRIPNFSIGGFNVTFFDLILGGLVISMIVGIAWKGAKG